MAQKVSAEIELEKQYSEYKAQFEKWKEANQSSYGTDAYNEYVSQFESWERDVERRRKTLRERAEREEREARQLRMEEEERARRTEAQKEAEAAKAYLESQQSYLAHHQAAIEAERAKSQMQTVQYHVATQNYGVVQTDGVYGAQAVVAATITNPSSSASINPAITQHLWGSNRINYDLKDPLFTRWGARAAPTHVAPILHSPKVPQPYWMVTEAMQERKKIIAPTAHSTIPPMRAPPPSLFSIHTLPPMNGAR